jgi:hypothetical protein
MTLHEFSVLPDHLKVELVWQGRFLSYRQEGRVTIVRYQVEDFFVDGYYNIIDDELINLQPLPAKNTLNHYFDTNLN